MTSYPLLLTIAFAMSGLVVAGDAFLKIGGKGTNLFLSPWFVLGAASYALSAFGWAYVIKYVKFATVGVIFSVAVVLVMAVIGAVFFKEKLNGMELLGIGMAVLSLVLLGRFSE